MLVGRILPTNLIVKRPRAFTLLELLVVMAILAVLMAILGSALPKARQQAKSLACLSNQRQIAMGIHAYTNDFHNHFPISQYTDYANSAWVTWDTTTYFRGTTRSSRPGLIWQYVTGESVQQCPSYEGPSMTSGDPFTGYNYNTTYLGRGENEGEHDRMGEEPALMSHVRRATSAAMIGDGGYAAGTNKFMRAPLDGGVAEGTVHAGAQSYRHQNRTNVAFIDGHCESRSAKFLRGQPTRQDCSKILGWPKNGFLSADDRAYAHR